MHHSLLCHNVYLSALNLVCKLNVHVHFFLEQKISSCSLQFLSDITLNIHVN